MGINNILTQILLQKNPDLSFAMEESFSAHCRIELPRRGAAEADL